MFDNKPRLTSTQAVNDSEVFWLERKHFIKTRHDFPHRHYRLLPFIKMMKNILSGADTEILLISRHEDAEDLHSEKELHSSEVPVKKKKMRKRLLQLYQNQGNYSIAVLLQPRQQMELKLHKLIKLIIQLIEDCISCQS